MTLAAAAVSGITASHTLFVYLPTLNTPHTSIAGVPHAASPVPPTPALARRLAVIVYDGLSYDVAMTLPELAPLRERGVVRGVAVEFPSFTSPALVSFMTGLGPRDSGTRRNGDLQGVPGIDSFMRAAGDARVPVTVWSHGYDDFARLIAPPAGTPIHEGKLACAVDMIRRGLHGTRDVAPPEPGAPVRTIDMIHWGLLDDTGHEHGSGSPEYARVAHDGAAFIARYAASLDLDRDALVVLSDHGHLDGPHGGHGGDEPEVRRALFLGVGASFRRGVELEARPMRDVASTLAVVAGLRAPTSSLGLPMIDALDLDGAAAARALAGPFEQGARFLCALRPDPRCNEAAPLAARLEGHDPAARPLAEALHGFLGLARDRDLGDLRDQGARRRLAFAALGSALALWTTLALLRRRGARFGPAAMLPILNIAVFTAYIWLRGYRPGFSYLRAAPLLVADAVPGALLAIAAIAFYARRTQPGVSGPWVLLLGTAIPFALLAAWVGWDPVTLPPPIAGAAVFQLSPSLVSAAVAAVVVAVMEIRRAPRAG
ncbi:Hypothetical protein A7982_02382 [Minicystis rosea]|nr:Hypothetical protein A7982_02382 [Minicystis rosea]